MNELKEDFEFLEKIEEQSSLKKYGKYLDQSHQWRYHNYIRIFSCKNCDLIAHIMPVSDSLYPKVGYMCDEEYLEDDPGCAALRMQKALE